MPAPPSAPLSDTRIGLLGAGQMARALAAGWVRTGLAKPGDLIAYDPSDAAFEAFTASVGAGVVRAASAAEAAGADALLLAIKPQYAAEALPAAIEGLRPETLVVSILAGTTLSTLAGMLPAGQPLVRVMPNTPCLVGRGASAYALGPGVADAQGAWVEALLSAVGFAAQVPEPLLDAVTGLSGSGPAYIYTIIEALADGGVRAGLPRKLAAELALHTVAGAAEMVAQTGEHPAVLREAVSSPAGTTIAGLGELERRGLRAALVEAVVTAAERARELGRG
ncbi:pyrroline-5-carboxylate reductase [Botrimarina hoheduenensis]|uniref:Pyrroline-5-carboxylate reductase n=1 Tax=Botrimarina hoheduenensis TaxID=2528000 RepID=A0A5C5WCQ4_9BACT|nr:pyrroline-5-carboxylate reductase [Botrimarina hoheduenensis]TWT48327.1 Pyrroline-5-carboxylate reductase [Botrimarina hoheduenensis]